MKWSLSFMPLSDTIEHTLFRIYSDQGHSVLGDTAPSNRHHPFETVDHNFEQWIR